MDGQDAYNAKMAIISRMVRIVSLVPKDVLHVIVKLIVYLVLSQSIFYIINHVYNVLTLKITVLSAYIIRTYRLKQLILLRYNHFNVLNVQMDQYTMVLNIAHHVLKHSILIMIRNHVNLALDYAINA